MVLIGAPLSESVYGRVYTFCNTPNPYEWAENTDFVHEHRTSPLSIFPLLMIPNVVGAHFLR